MTHPSTGAILPRPPDPRGDRLLASLTPEQAHAVRHGRGPLLIVAGPGAGKTRTLTHRIAHLLATGQASAWEIVAVTSSVRAAGELRLRLSDLLGEQHARGVTAATFHAVCARTLREHAAVFGRVRPTALCERGPEPQTLTQRHVPRTRVSPLPSVEANRKGHVYVASKSPRARRSARKRVRLRRDRVARGNARGPARRRARAVSGPPARRGRRRRRGHRRGFPYHPVEPGRRAAVRLHRGPGSRPARQRGRDLRRRRPARAARARPPRAGPVAAGDHRGEAQRHAG